MAVKSDKEKKKRSKGTGNKQGLEPKYRPKPQDHDPLGITPPASDAEVASSSLGTTGSTGRSWVKLPDSRPRTRDEPDDSEPPVDPNSDHDVPAVPADDSRPGLSATDQKRSELTMRAMKMMLSIPHN